MFKPKPLFLLAIAVLLISSVVSALRWQERQQQAQGLTKVVLPAQSLLRQVGDLAWRGDAKSNGAADSSDELIQPFQAMLELGQTQGDQIAWPGAALQLGQVMGGLEPVLDVLETQQRYLHLQLAFAGAKEGLEGLPTGAASARVNKTAAALSEINQRQTEAVLSKRLDLASQRLIQLAESGNHHLEQQHDHWQKQFWITVGLLLLIALLLVITRAPPLALLALVLGAVVVFMLHKQEGASRDRAAWIADPIITSSALASTGWTETQRAMQRFTQLVIMYREKAPEADIKSAYRSFTAIANGAQRRIIDAQARLEQPFLEMGEGNDENPADIGLRRKASYPPSVLELSKSLQNLSNSYSKYRGTVNLILVQQADRQPSRKTRHLASNLANEYHGVLATVVELERRAAQSAATLEQQLRRQGWWHWGIVIVLSVILLLSLLVRGRKSA